MLAALSASASGPGRVWVEPDAGHLCPMIEEFRWSLLPGLLQLTVEGEGSVRARWQKGGAEYANTLYHLVCKINSGAINHAVADLMGDLFLVGIEKRDENNKVCGTRPIGIPSALRRLAGRVLMEQESEKMGRVFTETKPDAAMLAAAGHAADVECNTPLQLGVGIAGGAEVAVAAASSRRSGTGPPIR